MSIQDCLNKIKTAIFGKDVRQAIYDAIKQCYDDAAVDHDNANMEVKLARGSHSTLNDRITENEKNQEKLSSDLDTIKIEKANESDLHVLNERMNQFSSLPEGSTTGDAELMDGRISILGNKYSNIGESIREQIKTVIKTNKISKTFNLSSSFNGGLLSFEALYLKGQTIDIVVNSDNILNKDGVLYFGYVDYNDEIHNNIIAIKPNNVGSYTFNSDCKSIRCWIETGHKINNGDIIITCSYTKSLYDDVRVIYENTDKIKNINKVLIGENTCIVDKTFNSTTYTTNDNLFTYNCELDANKTYYLKVNSDFIKDGNNIILGLNYKTSGIKTGILTFNVNNEVSFTTKNEEVVAIIIWIAKGNIISQGTLSTIIRNFSSTSINDNMNLVKKDVENNKKLIEKALSRPINGYFSIIGDSYSTYKDWIPSNYATWYSDDGNTLENNVSSVKDTWWWKLASETGLSLLTNSSFSGSTICNTGYDGSDGSSISFVTRAKKDIGQEKSLSVKPKIIFIFGGTNDSWANSPIGTVKYSGWTTEDLKSVLPAFCYLIDYLKTWNPGVRIINIVNTGLKTEITNGMTTACAYYDIENLVLSNIEKENGHPSINGMDEIKNQILSII